MMERQCRVSSEQHGVGSNAAKGKGPGNECGYKEQLNDATTRDYHRLSVSTVTTLASSADGSLRDTSPFSSGSSRKSTSSPVDAEAGSRRGKHTERNKRRRGSSFTTSPQYRRHTSERSRLVMDRPSNKRSRHIERSASLESQDSPVTNQTDQIQRKRNKCTPTERPPTPEKASTPQRRSCVSEDVSDDHVAVDVKGDLEHENKVSKKEWIAPKGTNRPARRGRSPRGRSRSPSGRKNMRGWWTEAKFQKAGRGRRSRSASRSSIDSEEDYRRSRSRERRRRHRQYLTMKKYNKNAPEKGQVLWDGFQWVKKESGLEAYGQQMNSTRRARRLHIGNLPLQLDATEEDFKQHLWGVLIQKGMCNTSISDESRCPVLNVWFARDRGGNYGFVEMATVEMAHAALQLDGFMWHNTAIRVNRPTDWKKAVSEKAIVALAGTSGLAVAEGLAAAAQQAAQTGNTEGLLSLVSTLPEDEQVAITRVMNDPSSHPEVVTQKKDRSIDLMRERIRADLLVGVPSRVVRIIKPSSQAQETYELEKVLKDMKEECHRYGTIVSTFAATPDEKENIPTVKEGDIYIEFATIVHADTCILNVSGRMYDGKPLKAVRFDEITWTQWLKPRAENLLLQTLNALIPPTA